MSNNGTHIQSWWGWAWVRGWGKLSVSQLNAVSSRRWERHSGPCRVELVASKNLTLHVDTFPLAPCICINIMCLLHPQAEVVWKGTIKYLCTAAPLAAQSCCLLELSEYQGPEGCWKSDQRGTESSVKYS